MTPKTFGTLEDGTEILEVEIAGPGGARARVITWGAVVRDLEVPTPRGRQPVVLGLERIEDYVNHSPHFGAIAGRFANRIAHGRFTLDGERHQLDRNQKGEHHLHGGSRGFSKRPWRLVSNTDGEVRLALTSPAGDMGYPGTLEASCVYRLEEPATLVVELEAQADAATPVNLTSHSYFNLDGAEDILDHTLQVQASHVTAVDADLIPTGEMRSVEGSGYDFRSPTRIRGEALGDALLYDINFVLNGAGEGLRHVATLASERSGVSMEVWTTEPGLQFYDGHKIDLPVEGLGGRHYARRGGLCLEAQRFPDSPNHPGFPSAILRPGEVYRHRTEYRFRAD